MTALQRTVKYDLFQEVGVALARQSETPKPQEGVKLTAYHLHPGVSDPLVSSARKSLPNITVCVQTCEGKQRALQIPMHMRVYELKNAISREMGIPVESQVLYWKSSELEKMKKLCDITMKDSICVTVVHKCLGG
eukprot:gi/632980018/ref/XP_007906795.1/ PREDICTED: uncharacterized protein LOC103188566 [Callorhinchus milii]